jgi:hypothetical protein
MGVVQRGLHVSVFFLLVVEFGAMGGASVQSVEADVSPMWAFKLKIVIRIS